MSSPFVRRSALALLLTLLCAPVLAQDASTPPGASATPPATPPGPEAEVAHVTAPVVLDGETLFRVRGASTYPAEDRARRISARIEEVARTASIAPEAVQATPAEEFVNIAAGDRFLVAGTGADAGIEALARRLLARVYVERIQAALRAYRQARDPQVLLRGARRALGATVLFLVALPPLLWAFRRLEARFARRYEERIRSVQSQSFEILRAQRTRRGL